MTKQTRTPPPPPPPPPPPYPHLLTLQVKLKESVLLASFFYDFLIIKKQEKLLDWKDKINFTIHDFITSLTNNCNAHAAQYHTK